MVDDAGLLEAIRRDLDRSPFSGEGHRKVWARLRHQGIRTASERVRRLMREHHLQAPRKGGNAHGPKAHDGVIITEEPVVNYCALYQGKATDPAAACPLFAGKQVAGKGWCSAWAKKA